MTTDEADRVLAAVAAYHLFMAPFPLHPAYSEEEWNAVDAARTRLLGQLGKKCGLDLSLRTAIEDLAQLIVVAKGKEQTP